MTVTVDAIYDGEALKPQVPLDLVPNEHYRVTIESLLPLQNSHAIEEPTEEEKDRRVARAWEIYDRKLKAILEPQFNGKLVVVHLDSEDYEVGSRSIVARKALRERHPKGPTVVIDIGPVRECSPLNMRGGGIRA